MITAEIYKNLKIGDTILECDFSIFHNLELTEVIIEDINENLVVINGRTIQKYNLINNEFYIFNDSKDTIREIIKIKYEKVLDNDWQEDIDSFKEVWEVEFPELFVS